MSEQLTPGMEVKLKVPLVSRGKELAAQHTKVNIISIRDNVAIIELKNKQRYSIESNKLYQ